MQASGVEQLGEKTEGNQLTVVCLEKAIKTEVVEGGVQEYECHHRVFDEIFFSQMTLCGFSGQPGYYY